MRKAVGSFTEDNPFSSIRVEEENKEASWHPKRGEEILLFSDLKRQQYYIPLQLQ